MVVEMICRKCNHHSFHTECPLCGTPDLYRITGFDIPSPLDWAYHAGQSTGEVIKNPPSLGSITAPLSSVANTVRYLMIGGAVLAGSVILYSVYQAWRHDLPGQAFSLVKEESRRSGELRKEAAKHIGKFA